MLSEQGLKNHNKEHTLAHIYEGLSQFCFIGDEGWAGVNFDRTKGGVLNENLDGEGRSVGWVRK